MTTSIRILCTGTQQTNTRGSWLVASKEFLK